MPSMCLQRQRISGAALATVFRPFFIGIAFAGPSRDRGRFCNSYPKRPSTHISVATIRPDENIAVPKSANSSKASRCSSSRRLTTLRMALSLFCSTGRSVHSSRDLSAQARSPIGATLRLDSRYLMIAMLARNIRLCRPLRIMASTSSARKRAETYPSRYAVRPFARLSPTAPQGFCPRSYIKFDGVQVHLTGGKRRVFIRNCFDWTKRF